MRCFSKYFRRELTFSANALTLQRYYRSIECGSGSVAHHTPTHSSHPTPQGGCSICMGVGRVAKGRLGPEGMRQEHGFVLRAGCQARRDMGD